jgi:hypothetical protein
MRTGNPDVDRARAHLVRAEKYSAIGDDAKAGAHFRRALEYNRRSTKTKGQQFGMPYEALFDPSIVAPLAGGAVGSLAGGVGGLMVGAAAMPMVAKAYGAAGAKAYEAAKGAAEKVSNYMFPNKAPNSGKEEAYAYPPPKVDFSGGIGKKYGPKEEYYYGKQDGSFMDFGGKQGGLSFQRHSARGARG